MGPRIFDKHLPQWFIAAFALVYLTGYLADFFYFSYIGIPDVGVELAKLKYIQTGLFFWLIFICTGGTIYLAISAEPASGERNLATAAAHPAHPAHPAEPGDSSDTSDPATSAPKFLNRSRWTYLVTAVLLPSIAIAVTFVPPAYFQDTAPRLAFGGLVFWNVIIFMWLNDRNEGMYKGNRDELRKASGRIAILMALGTLVFDGVIFHGLGRKLAEEWNNQREILKEDALGVALYLVIAFSFFKTVGRLFKRIMSGALSHKNRQDVEYAASMTILIVALFYLSLSSYAYVLLPLIPAERGGASYCYSPVVGIVADRDGGKETKYRGKVVYDTSMTTFLGIVDGTSPDPCSWRGVGRFPKIVAIQKANALLVVEANQIEGY